MDTAASVVPVPTVVSRSPLTSTSSEVMLPTTLRNSPVRLLLNSSTTLSDTLISVQPQFTIFPSVKLTPSEQVSERPIVIGSGEFYDIMSNIVSIYRRADIFFLKVLLFRRNLNSTLKSAVPIQTFPISILLQFLHPPKHHHPLKPYPSFKALN